MIRLALTFAVLCAVGCKTVDLPARYRPLRQISEGNPFGRDVVTTLSPTVWVNDISKFDDLDDPRIHALMMHELVHAKRQGKHWWQSWAWAMRYLVSPEFAWREEQLGWYVELQELRRMGMNINADWVANTLSSYTPRIVSFAEARAWVDDVLAGRWHPEED